MAMPAPKSIAKIAMNLPSASTEVASQTAPSTPCRSPYNVGLERAASGMAKSWMCTATMPRMPIPRSASSAAMREVGAGIVEWANLARAGY